MKKLLLFILSITTFAGAQSQRYDNFAATTASASGIGNITQVIAGATITVFNQPAVGVSCAGGGCVAATTFTSRTGGTPCGGGLPLTRPTANVCLATADSQGNFGFWAAAGAYQYCVAATNFTTTCFNIILGPTLDGSNAFTGPKPSIAVNSETVGTTNAVRWVGSAPMFTTVEAAQTDCQNDVTINACIVWVTSGFRETFTSTIVVGSSTKSTVFWLQNDVILTCNVTGGNDCFQIQQASGIVGHNVGEIGSSPRNAGAVIQIASTANIGNVITTALCNTTGGQGFIKLENLYISGNNSATVATHLNLCSLNNQPSVGNIFITAGTNSTGLLIQASSASGAVLGPISLFNVFVDCTYNAGCHPAKITNAVPPNDNSTQSIDINGGYFNHPGSGLPNFEINGNTTTHKALRGVRIKSYFENLSNGSTIGLKIVDAYNVDWTTSVFLMQDTDTCVDISQSAAGRTGAIHTGTFTCQSASSLVVDVNNHISSIGIPAGPYSVPFYSFGGDGSASFSAAVIDLLNLNVNGKVNAAGATSGTCGMGADATALVLIFGPCVSGTSRFYFNSFHNAFAINRNPQSGVVDNTGIWGTTFYPTNGNINFDVYNGSNTFQGTLQLPTITGGVTEAMPAVIASGTATMTTAAITAGNCGTTVTVSATGVATTDTITWAFNAAPAGSNAGIVAWPTANNVNFAYCSNTAQTPAAATINWRVIR